MIDTCSIVLVLTGLTGFLYNNNKVYRARTKSSKKVPKLKFEDHDCSFRLEKDLSDTVFGAVCIEKVGRQYARAWSSVSAGRPFVQPPFFGAGYIQ